MATTAKVKTEANPFEAVTGFDNETFKEGYKKMSENMTAFVDFQKESMEAAVASVNAFAKGFEKLTSANIEFAKVAFDDTVAAAKTATSSKSVQDAFESNVEFARNRVEKNIEQATKVSEICVDTAKNTAEPLNERYSALVEKIQSFRP